MIKARLTERKKICRLSELPQGGSCTAGILIEKNAGWRNKRPEVDTEKCVGCHQCYLYCPDGVIVKAQKGIVIDYDFCKGCGICAKVCALKAITMEDER